MAIRKFRKNMKPFIFIITIVFLLSLVYGGYVSFMTNRTNKKAQEAFRIDKTYVQKFEVERTKSEISQNVTKQNSKFEADNDLMTTIAIDKVIEQHLIKAVVKKLGIKVSGFEVNKQYEEIEKSIGDKDQFKRMLKAQGHTKDSFKAAIEQQLLMEKIIQKLGEEAQIDDNEVDSVLSTYKMINPTYTREMVIDKILRPMYAQQEYANLMHVLKKEAKITEVAPEYQNLMKKEEFNENGISVTNVDMAYIMLNYMLRGMTKEEARKTAEDSLKNELKIVKAANDNGVNIKEDLPLQTVVDRYQKELFNKLKDNVSVKEDDLKSFFNTYKQFYETVESAAADVIVMRVSPSEADEKDAQAAAEGLLKEVTPENFDKKGAELAKTGKFIYEKLGKFKKGQMVKEFEDAASSAKSNSIYDKVVKTGYGYHVVYVINNGSDNGGIMEAHHIMALAKPSEATKKVMMEKVDKISKDFESGAVTMDMIEKANKEVIYKSSIPNITRGSDLGLPNGAVAVDAILNANVGSVGQVDLDDTTILIYKKTAAQEHKDANFEESKDRVKNDYLNFKASEAIQKLFTK